MLTIAMMPKLVRSAYFESCRRGAEEAAADLGVKILWDGPANADAQGQAALVRKWMNAGIDALAVSVENPAIVSPAMRQARKSGLKVITWDADAEKDARDFFVNQATAEGIGDALSAEVARVLSGKGDIAVLTSTPNAPNQREWLEKIRSRLADRYPDIALVAMRTTNEDDQLARQETESLMREHPRLGAILAICSPAVTGAAEAVKRAQRADVRVIGTALPSICKHYVVEGWIESLILWNTVDLGYLTVHAAAALASGRLSRGNTSLTSGRLGKIIVRDDEIRLGRPHIYNSSNIDKQ